MAGELRFRSIEGYVDYQSSMDLMKRFTLCRADNTGDEVWFLQHPQVFTQGQAGKPEHLLESSAIPIIQSDRGGQVTYHGPGQLVGYFLLDIDRLGVGTRAFVTKVETCIIQLLGRYGIEAIGDRDAPGVYVKGGKIASLGFRVKRGRTYHGISLNIDMDMSPYSLINPCGYAGLTMTQMKSETNISCNFEKIAQDFAGILASGFGYTAQSWQSLTWETHEQSYAF